MTIFGDDREHGRVCSSPAVSILFEERAQPLRATHPTSQAALMTPVLALHAFADLLSSTPFDGGALFVP